MNDDVQQTEPAKFWLDLLADAAKADETYHQKCDSIEKRYADLDALAGAGDAEFDLFWANMEVLKPSTYSRPPVPVVSSRFKDRKALPRRASEVLERALSSDVEADGFHETLKCVRDDLLLFARSAPWTRLDLRDGRRVAVAEHLDRKDFRHDPARKWSEVDWVARRGWLTRDEFKDRFGAIPQGVNFKKQQDGEKHELGGKTAGVWEIWHKQRGMVVWVSEEAKEHVLDARQPILNLTGFFPCPMPAYGTQGKLRPVPDFVRIRHQLDEINLHTRRIAALTEALQIRGFYSGGSGDISEAIEAAMKTRDDRATLVPVPSLAALGGSGMRDAVIWWPIEQIAQTVRELIQNRRQLIDDVYQITGLSDIMRGSTAASETLGAQQLKAQFGSIRIRDKQEEMVRVAQDLLKLKAEIMCENVPLEDILDMAQVDDIPTAIQIEQRAFQALQQASQQGPEAVQAVKAQIAKEAEEQVTQEELAALFANQRIRPFMLEIDTDSTIQFDENAEKQRRTEFVGAVGSFMAEVAPLVQATPILAPLAAEALQYLASGFRAGRVIQMEIDELAEKMREIAKAPQRPDPAAQAAADEQRAATARADALANADVQLKGAQAQSLMQPKTEPVSVDPKDQMNAVLKSREIDLKEGALKIEAAKTYATLVQHEEDAERTVTNDASV